VESHHDLIFLFEHDLFGKPVSTFPDHALDLEAVRVVALRGREVDAFLARPDPGRPIILLYGPDAGLVRERADALMASAVDDLTDPFSLVRMDGDELAAEPSRLVEEAMTVPLFGGRRAIRVRAGGKSFASGVDTLAEMPLKDCRIVIEAGELRPESPLRKACERAKTAVAIGCYPDGERDIAKLIDDELRASNLRIAPDARASLVALLGGDRQATRGELRKLTLYAHGTGEVTLDDVMAVVADASELKLDPIVDGAFAGNPAVVETEFTKAMTAGTYPGVIVSAAQRQAALLHKASLAVEDGAPAAVVVESGFPRLHFSRKAVVETALRNFTPARLVLVIDQLATAALEMRKQSTLAAVIAQRALLSIAANARRRG
jgi:DNA polymerase-3 subunit delta